MKIVCILILISGCAYMPGTIDIDVLEITYSASTQEIADSGEYDIIRFYVQNSGDEALTMIRINFDVDIGGVIYKRAVQWGWESRYGSALFSMETKPIKTQESIYLAGIDSLEINNIELMYHYDEYIMIDYN